MIDRTEMAAYGGAGWRPRERSLRKERGTIWGDFGIRDEWSPLKSVLMHRPGAEFTSITDPNEALFLDKPDLSRIQHQHDQLVLTYQDLGVNVFYVDPKGLPPVNLVYAADTFVMTPEGAIVGRPASTIRAGEEVLIARRLADLSIPILLSVHGKGTFEGADAIWINQQTVLVGLGMRTNRVGASQLGTILGSIGVQVHPIEMPPEVMHLMGCLRLVDHDLAIGWPGRLPDSAIKVMENHGIQTQFIPDQNEAINGFALNFVTLAPKVILMASDNPITKRFYTSLGIKCHPVQVDELHKAAGGIACMTGILAREPIG